MKELFTEINTEGYTAEEIYDLNQEWFVKCAAEKLEENTEEYYRQAQIFSDMVSRR